MDGSRSHRTVGLLAALTMALGLSGCLTGAEHGVTPSRPTIGSFTASPTAVAPGQTSVLSWTVTGATSLSISPGLGAVTGTSVTVRPLATTTYTLTATNEGGTSSKSLTVSLTSAPAGLTYSQNPATYTEGVAITPNAPSSTGGAITSYSVSPDLPTGLSLHPTTGIVSGTPAAATPMAVYTVTGANAAGTTSAALVVTVLGPSPPTIVSFTATPTAISTGQSSVLAWNVVGATLLSIDNGVGTVVGTSTTVSPTATTTYRLSATNAGGTVTADVTVEFLGPPSNLRYATNPASYSRRGRDRGERPRLGRGHAHLLRRGPSGRPRPGCDDGRHLRDAHDRHPGDLLHDHRLQRGGKHGGDPGHHGRGWRPRPHEPGLLRESGRLHDGHPHHAEHRVQQRGRHHRSTP